MRIIELYSNKGDHTIRAAVIGTCRLANPLNELREIDGAKVLWAHSGFAHSIHDAMQWISLIKNEKTVPKGLYQLIFGRTFEELNGSETEKKFQRGLELFNSCDILILEISSNKRVHTKNFDFNSNYLNNNFIRPGGIEILNWWSKVCKGGDISKEEIQKGIETISEKKLFTKKDSKMILSECKMTIDENKEMLKSINKLNNDLKDMECIIIVNPDPSYSNVSKFLSSESRKNKKFKYLDPNTLIKNFKVEEVFMGKGKDKNHYDEEFNIKVGEHIRNFIFSDKRILSDF
tara:strand:- start:62 stop:931 length:870 start_codon:yes stop_codon:yes gene_type:complete